MKDRGFDLKRAAVRTALALAVGLGGAAQASPARAAGYDISFGRGETKGVGERCAISGDIKVDRKPVHDDDALSALIVEFRRPAAVEAPWGASGRCTDNDQELADWIAAQKARNAANGFVRTDHEVIASSVVPNQETTGTCTDDISMSNGETRRLPAGSVGKGDVRVNGEALYDNREETGLVFVLTEDANVEAPWGANIQVIKNCFEGADVARNRIVSLFVSQLRESGCGSRCDSVDVVYAPGGKQANVEQAIARANAQASWIRRAIVA